MYHAGFRLRCWALREAIERSHASKAVRRGAALTPVNVVLLSVSLAESTDKLAWLGADLVKTNRHGAVLIRRRAAHPHVMRELGLDDEAKPLVQRSGPHVDLQYKEFHG
jgi:hypothetical protein